MKNTLGRRKKWSWGIALSILAFFSVYSFLYEPAAHALPPGFAMKHTPLLIAHRGAGDLAPENTLAALRVAMEIGLDGAELDMQLSKDGQVIIFHDPFLERLTDGKGLVGEKTLSELQALDAGSKFSERFSDERIPTFDEVLELVSGKIVLIVELKDSTIRNDGSEKAVVDIIQKHDAFDWVIVDSFNPVALWRIRRLEPRIMTAFDFRDVQPEDSTQLRGVPWPLRQEWIRRALRKIMKPNFLEPESTVAEKTLSVLSSRGWPMLFWTINDAGGLEKILKLNPWGILTDRPMILLEVMARKN